jgi:ABC-type sugar transport system substrate-binding protein
MALLAALLVLGGCGDDDEGSQESAGNNGGEQPAAAEVKFESFETEVPEGYEEPEGGKYRFAYLNPVGGNEFLITLGDAMRREVERLGGRYTEYDAKGDVNAQVSQFEQAIAQGVDGLAVFALDPGSIAPAVKRAKEKDIALVTIDLDFSAEPDLQGFDTQVLQRRDEAAYLGAKRMAELLKGKGTVGTIDFAVKVPSIVYSIEQGKAWAKKFGLKVGGNASNPSDDIAGGERAMTQLLGDNPDISGVIAYNDPSAIGAKSAARSQGKPDMPIGGQNGGSDALEAIAAGRQTYTPRLDVTSMGKAFAWGLYNVKNGKDVPKSVKAGPPVLVTKDNVGEQVPWDEMLEKEYGGGN